jgi:phosphatidate phosphatase APP1
MKRIGFNSILIKASGPFRMLSLWIKKKLGLIGEPHIVIYNCFGNEHNVFITGVVMTGRGLMKPKADQTAWKNMMSMVARYMSDVIPGVRVKLSAGSSSVVLTTDSNGTFRTMITPGFGSDLFTHVECNLLDTVSEDQGTITAIAPLAYIEPEPDFHVISDIDDTVMVSHSTRFLMKMRLMLFRNAHTRSPFEGVAEFYHALTGQQGSPGGRTIFYVSGSEWNLYDLIVDFFSNKGIPSGPLLLSDARKNIWSLFTSGNTYLEKVNRIKDLFTHFPSAEFILIGDSGQRDPEIYLEIASMFPSRVRTVYIRMVGSRRKKKRLERLMKEAKNSGIEMVAVETSSEAMTHAQKKGYARISTDIAPASMKQ